MLLLFVASSHRLYSCSVDLNDLPEENQNLLPGANVENAGDSTGAAESTDALYEAVSESASLYSERLSKNSERLSLYSDRLSLYCERLAQAERVKLLACGSRLVHRGEDPAHVARMLQGMSVAPLVRCVLSLCVSLSSQRERTPQSAESKCAACQR